MYGGMMVVNQTSVDVRENHADFDGEPIEDGHNPPEVSEDNRPRLVESTLSLSDLMEAHDTSLDGERSGADSSKSRANSISSYSRAGSLDRANDLSSTPPFSIHGHGHHHADVDFGRAGSNAGNGDLPIVVAQNGTGGTPRRDMLAAKWSCDSVRDTNCNHQLASRHANVPGAGIGAGSYLPSEYLLASSNASNSSSSTSRSTMRPINLYSAIGSLENLNTTTVGSLNKRLLSSIRRGDFARAGGGSLIPPQSAGGPLVIRPRHKGNQTGVRSQPVLLHRISSSSKDEGMTEQNTEDGSKAKIKNVTGRLTAEESQHTDEPGASITPAVQSSLRPSRSIRDRDRRVDRKRLEPKKVTYDHSTKNARNTFKGVEMFRPSCDAYTPRMEKKKIPFKPAEKRTLVHDMSSPMGTLQRPNFRDALRRVAMIIHQHIVKIEQRFETTDSSEINSGIFKTSMRDAFSEDNFCTPTYQCTMVRIPMARPGMVYGLRKVRKRYLVPSENEIYEFAHSLFKTVQLSSECSIVCLIYVERLMEAAKVPLLGCTWRPVFMCGLLMASKVWQDLSSWNIEFASVYPQFSLDAINRLELVFLRMIKWDLYISSSLYAKYYFALRSLVEKKDFRQRYNRMVGVVGSVAQSEALKIQQRTEQVKEEALQHLSKSM